MISYSDWKMDEASIGPQGDPTLEKIYDAIRKIVKESGGKEPSDRKIHHSQLVGLLKHLIPQIQQQGTPAQATPSSASPAAGTSQGSPITPATTPAPAPQGLTQPPSPTPVSTSHAKGPISHFENLGMLLHYGGNVETTYVKGLHEGKPKDILQNDLMNKIREEMENAGYGNYFYVVKRYVQAVKKGNTQDADQARFMLEQIAKRKDKIRLTPKKKLAPGEISKKEKVELIRQVQPVELIKKLLQRGVSADAINKINPLIAHEVNYLKRYYSAS